MSTSTESSTTTMPADRAVSDPPVTGRRLRARHSSRVSRVAMARTRGAVSGPLLILLGVWGGLIPFIGHAFGYGYTPDATWQWTAARGWLEVLPAAVTIVAGLTISLSANRITAIVGGWLAMLSGAWFVLGPLTSPMWSPGFLGVPSGTTPGQIFVEQLGMFFGLGCAILAVAGFVTGRVSVIGVRDVAAAERRAEAAQAQEAGVYPGDAAATTAATAPTATHRAV